MKGQSDLKNVLLAVVVGLLILGIGWKIANMVKTGTELSLCRTSTIAAASFRGTGLSPNRECSTKLDDTIEGMKDKEKIADATADLVWECWYENAEGKYHTFAGKMTSKDAHCFICSTFSMPKRFDGKTVDTRVTNQELLDAMAKHHYKGETKPVLDYVKSGILRWRGVDMLLVQHVDIPAAAGGKEKWIDSFVTLPATWVNHPILGSVPLINAVMSIPELWQVWFDKLEILPMRELHYDLVRQDQQYAVVYYQVSQQFARQTWEAKKTIDLIGGDTAKALVEIPPAKVFVTKLSLVAESDCEVLG